MLNVLGLVTAGVALGQPPAPPNPLRQEPTLPMPQRNAVPAEPVLDLVEFRNTPLTDAMRLLSQESGLSIVPSAEAGKVMVSVYLQHVAPMTAVAAIAQANGLVYRRDAATGIIRIFTTKENQRDLASFREDETKVFTLLYPNAVNVATAIRDLFGERVLLSYGVNEYNSLDDLQARFSRFDLINSRTLGVGLPGGVGGTAFGAGGFGSGFGLGGGGLGAGGALGNRFGAGGGGYGTLGYSGMNTPALADNAASRARADQETKPEQRLQGLTPEEIQILENAAAQKGAPDREAVAELLRRRPTSIFVTIIKSNNQLMVRTSDPQALAQIIDLVTQLDVPTPVVLLEVKVLSVDLSDNFHSVFDYQFTDGVRTAGGFTTGNILPPAADALSESARRFVGITPAGLAGAPGTDRDLVFQFVSANFRARLQLLEDKNRVTELAAPLLMTANNEVSRIFIGESRPITIGFNAPQVIATGVGATTTVAGTPITTLQDLGTTLLITPNINNDRTVTLRLLQENSRPDPGGGSIPVPNATGGVTQVPVDIVRRQNLSGTIVAKDGYTIAIGGLIEENVHDLRSEVPILGRIPGIGIFFRRQETGRSRRELIVLVRPFVLSTPCESSGASSALVQSLSVHPKTPNPEGTLGTYLPGDAPYPCPPQTKLQSIFQLHSVCPKDCDKNGVGP